MLFEDKIFERFDVYRYWLEPVYAEGERVKYRVFSYRNQGNVDKIYVSSLTFPMLPRIIIDSELRFKKGDFVNPAEMIKANKRYPFRRAFHDGRMHRVL